MDDEPVNRVGVGRWHAWRCTQKRALGIGPVPGRKSLALYVQRGSTKEPVAYFTSDEAASEALELLGDLAWGQFD